MEESIYLFRTESLASLWTLEDLSKLKKLNVWNGDYLEALSEEWEDIQHGKAGFCRHIPLKQRLVVGLCFCVSSNWNTRFHNYKLDAKWKQLASLNEFCSLLVHFVLIRLDSRRKKNIMIYVISKERWKASVYYGSEFSCSV